MVLYCFTSILGVNAPLKTCQRIIYIRHLRHVPASGRHINLSDLDALVFGQLIDYTVQDIAAGNVIVESAAVELAPFGERKLAMMVPEHAVQRLLAGVPVKNIIS